MGNYHVPIKMLLKFIFEDCKIQQAPPITKKTLELGSKYSPDFVCVPFKYNLGNYIEALENGANVLIQAGGGCRFGYYGEVQEQILRDLGYDFEFIYFLGDSIKPFSVYKTCRKMGCKLSLYKFAYYIKLIFEVVKSMDKIDDFIRKNIGFESELGSFEKMYKKFLNELKAVRNFKSLNYIYKKYNYMFKNIKINKPENCLKIGLVGELYNLMEPFSNYFIEKELAGYNVEITRFINVTYLLFEKPKLIKKTIKEAGKYLKYFIGADGTDTVANSKSLAELGYDGIIHMKPFGCTPEVNAMPMLQNISEDFKIPILYFSFDSQTSETGIKTRLEAFNDMLLMRRQKK